MKLITFILLLSLQSIGAEPSIGTEAIAIGSKDALWTISGTMPPQPAGNCSVQIGYPYLMLSSQCYSGQVMVGVDRFSRGILCAPIAVTCPIE